MKSLPQKDVSLENNIVDVKHVVTAFIQREEDNKILLMKRSKDVGTYKGKWASVSGYIEKYDKKPLNRAFIEIREEIGLSSSEVQKICEGEIVYGKGKDVIWAIHPFLFKIKKGRKIKLDWEHTEYRWIRPEEIDRYDGVPRLKEALLSVQKRGRRRRK